MRISNYTVIILVFHDEPDIRIIEIIQPFDDAKKILYYLVPTLYFFVEKKMYLRVLILS